MNDDDRGNVISSGNGNPMVMGISYSVGSGNGREWECKSPFPVVSGCSSATAGAAGSAGGD